MLWEFIKWSPIGKCFDLLSETSNLFLFSNNSSVPGPFRRVVKQQKCSLSECSYPFLSRRKRLNTILNFSKPLYCILRCSNIIFLLTFAYWDVATLFFSTFRKIISTAFFYPVNAKNCTKLFAWINLARKLFSELVQAFFIPVGSAFLPQFHERVLVQLVSPSLLKAHKQIFVPLL